MPRDRVVLVPYDPDWAVRFDAERNLLAATLGAWLDGGIHHIGSTAVPGIAAKAVIDMLRADPALAAEYEALKARLAEDHGSDLAAYTTGKRGFVARVLAGAGLELRTP